MKKKRTTRSNEPNSHSVRSWLSDPQPARSARSCCFRKRLAGSIHPGHNLRTALASSDALLPPPHAGRPQHAGWGTGHYRGHQLNQALGETAATSAIVLATACSAGGRHAKYLIRGNWGGSFRNGGRERNESVEVGSAWFRRCAQDDAEYGNSSHLGLSAGAKRCVVFVRVFHYILFLSNSRASAQRLTPWIRSSTRRLGGEALVFPALECG